MGNRRTAKRKAQRRRQKARERALIEEGKLVRLSATEHTRLQRRSSKKEYDLRFKPTQAENADNLKKALIRILLPVTRDIMTYMGRYSLIGYMPVIAESELPSLRSLFRDAVPLIGLERQFAGRMNPRSFYYPSVLKQHLDAIPRQNKLTRMVNRKTLYEAARNVKEYLNLSFEPMSDLESMLYLLNKETTTSAGSPWFVRREGACYKYLSKAWRAFSQRREASAKTLWESIGEPDPLDIMRDGNFPFLINYRVEASGDELLTKHRVVWASPLPHQLLETKYAAPIVAELQVSQFELTYNNRRFTKRRKSIKELVSDDKLHGQLFSYLPAGQLHQTLCAMREDAISMATPMLSLDYTAFDQHVAVEMCELGFAALGIGDSPDERMIKHRFIHKHLHTPWGTFDFSGNVPSGSVFTNLVDSAVNAIALEYMRLRIGCSARFRVNGDDAVMIADKTIFFSEIEELAAELGMSMNQSKQIQSPDKGFLFNRSYWGPQFDGPVPSLNKMMNSIARRDMIRARQPLTPNTEVLRTMQIIEACTHHPLVRRLIDSLRKIQGPDRIRLLDYRARVLPAFAELAELTSAKLGDPEELLERYSLFDKYIYAEQGRKKK